MTKASPPGYPSAPFLLVGGREAFPALLAALDGAKESVYLRSFIWRDDGIGNRIGKAVLAAARRGVRVTVVKDRYGIVLEKAEEAKLSFFHKKQTLTEKIKSTFLCLLYAREAGVRPRRDEESELYRALCAHPNITLDTERHRADHSKICIVDGEELFLGGINIEDKEAGRDLLGREYADYMVQLRGREWVDAFLAASRTGGSPIFPMNCKEGGFFELRRHYLSLIRAARRELLIVMPYFSPLRDVRREVLAAAARGVRVTVLLPRRANFQNNSNRRAARLLQRKSGGRVRILLSEKMLHTKLILADDTVSLGSANITKKAFGSLDEANLCLGREDAPGLYAALLADLERECSAATPAAPRDLRYSPPAAALEGLLV